MLLYGSWLQDRRVVLALLPGDGVATILVVTVRRRGGVSFDGYKGKGGDNGTGYMGKVGDDNINSYRKKEGWC